MSQKSQGIAMARRHPVKAATRHLPYYESLAHNSAAAREIVTGILEGLATDARCARCGKKLTDPDSRAHGVGPDCLKILGGPAGWSARASELCGTAQPGLARTSDVRGSETTPTTDEVSP